MSNSIISIDRSTMISGSTDQKESLLEKHFEAAVQLESLSFSTEARRPLSCFMRYAGLYDAPTNNKYLKLFRFSIILFLIAMVFRRAQQIGTGTPNSELSFTDAFLDPSLMMTLIRFSYTISALATNLIHYQLHRTRTAFLQAVDLAMDPEYAAVNARRTRKSIALLIGFDLGMTIFGCTMETLYKTDFMSDVHMPPLIAPGYKYLVFDFLWVMICQVSITMVVAEFYISCVLLRYLIEDVCRHMGRNFRDAPTIVKLHYLDDIQTHHHRLTQAMKKLEDCYSLALFVYYSLAVPTCCFMTYICYRSSSDHPGFTFVIGVWVTSIVILLLIMSIPAFQLTEEGETLAVTAFEMYQNCLRGEDDGRLTTQFSILISQIQTHRIEISAYNYFPMNRAMLLSCEFFQKMSNSIDKSTVISASTEPKKSLLEKQYETPVQLEPLSFSKEARRPLARFMRFAGLYDAPCTSKWITLYRFGIIGFLTITTIRHAGQIGRGPNSPPITFQESLFDPNLMITVVRFFYTFAALATALILFHLDESRTAFMQAVDLTMDPEYAAVNARRTRKPIALLIGFDLMITLFGCTMETIYKTDILGDLHQPPLIAPGWKYLIFDWIWVMSCQSCITMVAAEFFLACTVLRYLIQDVCRHMGRNFRDAPTLVKLHYLDDIQTHHHRLTRAMKKLEDCFSFPLFIYYSFAVPSCCFMTYICYRSSGGHAGITIGIAIWITSIIILLLIMSIPAFQLTEEGEQLSESAFEMYQNCLRGEEDGRLTTQFSILISQIQSHPIEISAYNYFPLNRAMLLSMFSVIFTYFLILVQFSEDKEPTVSPRFAELEEALAICRNGSLLLF